MIDPSGAARVSTCTLQDDMDARLARACERQLDWQAFAAQAGQDPRHRRAQVRYMSAAGAARQPGLVPAEGFYLVQILYPPGHCSPMHRHDDAEEAFYVLKGTVKIAVEHEGQRYEVVLMPNDFLSVPAGLYRQEINPGSEDAAVCVIVGAGRPERPVPMPSQNVRKE